MFVFVPSYPCNEEESSFSTILLVIIVLILLLVALRNFLKFKIQKKTMWTRYELCELPSTPPLQNTPRALESKVSKMWTISIKGHLIVSL